MRNSSDNGILGDPVHRLWLGLLFRLVAVVLSPAAVELDEEVDVGEHGCVGLVWMRGMGMLTGS